MALVLVHLLVVVHVAHWKVSGRTCTPLEPSESMQTLELGYVNAGVVVFAATLLLTLIFGRFFCGWACHVVAYQDLCAWLLEKLHLRPRPLRARILKFVPLYVAFEMFVQPSLARWLDGRAAPVFTAHFTTESFWRTFPGPWMAALTILVDGALIVAWLGAKGFCTYGCPYGALFGVADRLAVSRIVVSDACEGCGHCTQVCTSNVRVHEEVATFGAVVDAGCMKCLDCVRSCPKEALRLGLAKPTWFRRLAARSSSRASDLTWPEELLAIATFFAARYAFRDLYSKVPNLLAIGLAAIAAIGVVALTRQLTQRTFQWQWAAWKQDGRWTRAGVAGVALVAAFLAFALHSTLVQYQERAGEACLARWTSDPRDVAAADRAETHFTNAIALGLFPDGNPESMLALLCRQRGRPDEALTHARRALDVERTAGHLVALATILADLGQRDGAHDALREAVALDPGNAEVRRRLQRFESR